MRVLRHLPPALVLAALACQRDVTAPGPSPVVQVTASPSVAMPGQLVSAIITVTPPDQATVDRVVIVVSGVMAAAESLDVGLPGTFSASRYYTLRRDTLGQLIIRASAWVGTARGTGETLVTVADTIRPTISTFSVTPTGTTLQPGDTFNVYLSAFDPVGVKYSILRVTGALTVTDSASHGLGTFAQHVLGRRIPATVALGQNLQITAEVVDGVGNRSTSALTPILVNDLRPPTVTASALNAHGTTGFAPGDTISLTVQARDNYRLAKVGYAILGPVRLADSATVSDTTYLHTVRIPTTASMTGTSTVRVFAVDAAGYRTEFAVASITVDSRTRRPIVSGPLGAAARDFAFDAKRGVVYVSETDSNLVGVFDVAAGSWGSPITFPVGPHGVDLSLSGDSLFVALRTRTYVAVVNLVTGARDSLVVVAGNAFLDQGPDNVRMMANGKLLVSLTFYGSGYGGSIVTADPATRAYQYRWTVTEVVPLCRSGDRTRLLFLIDDSCCPIEGMVYDAATDGLAADRGTVSRYFVSGSADNTGSHYLVNGSLFDAVLAGLGAVSPSAYADGDATVIAPNGADAYYATASGITHARLSDGHVLESFPLPAKPYRMAISADGLTLAAAAGGLLYVIDLW